MYVCNQPCIHGMNGGSNQGVPPGPARGGSQTAVISEKRPKFGFLMTGLVTQGVIFQTRKGRPIVLLIRVLWTDSRTWICRPIYGVLCGPIYAHIWGYIWGYLGRGGTWYAITHMCVHPCVHTCVPPTPQHTSNTHVFVCIHAVMLIHTCPCIYICRSSAHAICQN